MVDLSAMRRCRGSSTCCCRVRGGAT